MAQFNDHYSNLLRANQQQLADTGYPVVSASKALDYMDGVQGKWHEALLDDPARGIKDWRKRGVQPIIENLVGKVVKRSALSYQEPPRRHLADAAGNQLDKPTETYNAILKGADFSEVMKEADRVARLLKAAIILPWYIQETGEFRISILHRGNCDVDFDPRTGAVRSILYTTASLTVNATTGSTSRPFCYIDKDRIVDLVADAYGGLTVVGQEDNPYGFVPISWIYDEQVPRTGFFPRDQWQDLVLLNEALNVLNTLLAFGVRYQMLGVPVTDAEIADGTVIGPDAPLKISGQMGQNPTFKFERPEGNIAEFIQAFQALIGRVADAWGVNLEVAGAGSADSGFKLIVKEVWNLETRKARRANADAFERRFYKLIQAMGAKHGIVLPDTTLEVEWQEVALPVDEAGKWTVAQGKLAAGVMSRRQYLKSEHPEATDEEITAMLEEIDAERTTPLTAAKAKLDAALGLKPTTA